MNGSAPRTGWTTLERDEFQRILDLADSAMREGNGALVRELIEVAFALVDAHDYSIQVVGAELSRGQDLIEEMLGVG